MTTKTEPKKIYIRLHAEVSDEQVETTFQEAIRELQKRAASTYITRLLALTDDVCREVGRLSFMEKVKQLKGCQIIVPSARVAALTPTNDRINIINAAIGLAIALKE